MTKDEARVATRLLNTFWKFGLMPLYVTMYEFNAEDHTEFLTVRTIYKLVAKIDIAEDEDG